MMQKTIIKQRLYDDSIIWQESVHPLLQRIYSARNINPQSKLDLSLKDLLPPDNLKNVHQAAALLGDFLIANKSMMIIGDFDADGATSTALMKTALEQMGANKVSYLVPNRFEYGYGLTPGIVEEAILLKPELIITVDNGISSHEGVALARKNNISVLITDHHLQGSTLPDANVIVNPNQLGDKFVSKSLAGVGVVFYILIALRQYLRDINWFKQQSIAEPVLANYLDIVALGTVADVVPLDHNNRILVSEGLKRIRANKCVPGITALLEASGRIPSKALATDLGFAVGPRLNAAGRLDDMSVGIECLLSDQTTAKKIAFKLDVLNQQRRSIEADMKSEALAFLDKMNVVADSIYGLVMFDENWHQGVIGILASRVKDKIHRPVIIFAPGDLGEIKGSCRSIKGIHIRDVLEAISTQHPNLIKKFGGHAMAAGLTINHKDFDTFHEFFNQQVERVATEDILQNDILTDGQLALEEFTLDVANMINDAGPWGQEFPEPVFSGIFEVVTQRVLKDKHYKLVLSPDGQQEFCIDAIAFNQIDENTIKTELPSQIEVAYKLSINDYRGQRSLQLMIEHIMAA